MKVSLTQKWAEFKADRQLAKQLKTWERDIDRHDETQLRAEVIAKRHAAAGLVMPPANFSAVFSRRLSESQLAWCVVNLPGFEHWPRSEADTKEHLGAPYPAANELK